MRQYPAIEEIRGEWERRLEFCDRMLRIAHDAVRRNPCEATSLALTAALELSEGVEAQAKEWLLDD